MKPQFEELNIESIGLYFPLGGNKVGYLPIMATIKLRERTEAEQLEYQKKMAELKYLYEKITVGTKFKADGEKANKELKCKITSINHKTKMVSWKQFNLPPNSEFKPASGKWSIEATISLFNTKQLIFI